MLTKGRIATTHESFSRLQRENVYFKKLLYLNWFSIKRFAHPCCRHVLFLELCCHWLKGERYLGCGVQLLTLWCWK